MKMISQPTAAPSGLLEDGYGHFSESQKVALVLTRAFHDPQTDKGYLCLHSLQDS